MSTPKNPSGPDFEEEDADAPDTAIPADTSLGGLDSDQLQDIDGLETKFDRSGEHPEHAPQTSVMQITSGNRNESSITSGIVVPFAKDPNLNDPLVGDRFEKYRVISMSGQATMFAGVQISTGAPVAIKEARRDSKKLTQMMHPRLRREQYANEKLRDVPGVVHVRDWIEEEVTLVMDFVDGETLTRAMKKLKSIPEKLRVIEAICRTVAGAHEHDIIHRDLKPDNILLDKQDKVHVLDFGLALLKERTDALTGIGDILGSPGYMSPEQADGEGADERTDVYAVGLIFMELLTGLKALQIKKDDQMGMIRAHSQNKLRPVFQLAARDGVKVPLDLQAICNKMTKKEPDERYHSMEAVLADLEKYRLGLEVTARRHGPIRRLATGVKKNLGLVAMLLIALSILGVFWWQYATMNAHLEAAVNTAENRDYSTSEDKVEAAIRLDWFGQYEDRIGRTQDRIKRTRLALSIQDGEKALDDGDLTTAKKLADEVLQQDEEHVGAKQLLEEISAAKISLLVQDAASVVRETLSQEGSEDFTTADQKIRELLDIDPGNITGLQLRAEVDNVRNQQAAKRELIELLTTCDEESKKLADSIDTQGERDALTLEGWSTIETSARSIIVRLDEAGVLTGRIPTRDQDEKREMLRSLKEGLRNIVDTSRSNLSKIGSVSRYDIDEMHMARYELAVQLIEKERELTRAIALIESVMAYWSNTNLHDITMFADTIRDAEGKLEEAKTSLKAQEDKKTEELAGLRENIASLNGDVTRLNTEISSLNSKVRSIQEEKSLLESQKELLQTQLSGKEQEISKLEEKVTNLSSQLTQLNADLATALSNVTTADEKLKAVETELQQTKETVISHVKNIDEMRQERAKAAEKAAADTEKWTTMSDHIDKQEWEAALKICEELIESGNAAAPVMKGIIEARMQNP